ncbi:hypothetical protein SE17_13960 [Kouleothrix aurantiaca]|uniref:Uncharacterized protein n=1 Tax=Kouleothrix aurantiaca TaxID=186479 RepID=A0A0P9D1A1_9CHLR|nr:hypothetical protein SE17_13960 [Kouleothrix aurantiaca]
MRKIFLPLLLGAFALAACGTPATGGTASTAPASTQPTANTPPTAAPEPTGAPTDAPTAAPTDAPTIPPAPTHTPAPSAAPGGPKPGVGAGGTSVRPPDALIKAAQQQLAAFLKRPVSEVVLQSANKQEWGDGSLGCPVEGMLYPQVVTEGFLLIFTTDNQTQQYEVHTGLTPAQMLLCANGKATTISAAGSAEPGAANPPALDAPGQAMLALARATLAKDLGLQETAVQVLSGEPVEWNDSSLGCPTPDQMALQVITPGYRFVLQSGGQSYELHTDAGKRVVRCDALK